MQKVLDYTRKNWLKIGIALLLLFLAMKKDLSFNINLNTPAAIPDSGPQEIPVNIPTKSERYTDNKRSKAFSEASSEMPVDRFELQPFTTDPTQPLSSALSALQEVNEATREAFIQRFAKVAVAERDKFGIPASLILANALLLSQGGQSDLAQDGNNFFQLRCTTDWQGPTLNQGKECYRQYESAWMSFRDHSYFLTTGHFSKLRQLGAKNYQAWAKGMEETGYPGEKGYAKQVVKLIRDYKLARWDDL
ncbi:MAG: glucosaminidase domain-containing protein [Lewinellaceae bacterium]|nr:glucosaminidase domain-containing protein [Lewinellaceae bacterium]